MSMYNGIIGSVFPQNVLPYDNGTLSARGTYAPRRPFFTNKPNIDNMDFKPNRAEKEAAAAMERQRKLKQRVPKPSPPKPKQ